MQKKEEKTMSGKVEMCSEAVSKMGPLYDQIDHIAIAVKDLPKAISFYRDILGLEVVEERETLGKFSGMVSAVLSAGKFSIVLVQGTSEKSQVSQYIEAYGVGVQHVALAVDDIDDAVATLKEKGIEFVTDIIVGSGIKQIFSRRDKTSGMMFEIIERTSQNGFQDDTVKNLFDQLESKEAF